MSWFIPNLISYCFLCDIPPFFPSLMRPLGVASILSCPCCEVFSFKRAEVILPHCQDINKAASSSLSCLPPPLTLRLPPFLCFPLLPAELWVWWQRLGKLCRHGWWKRCSTFVLFWNSGFLKIVASFVLLKRKWRSSGCVFLCLTMKPGDILKHPGTTLHFLSFGNILYLV